MAISNELFQQQN